MRAVITRILPGYPTKVDLQWDLEAVTESGTFLFDVERSGSTEGPWTAIATGLTATTYTDQLDQEEANVLSLARDIYYRIRVVPPSGATNEFYSVVVNLDGQAQLEVRDPQPAIGYTVSTDAQVEVPPTTGLAPRPDHRGFRRLLRRKIRREEEILFRKLAGIEFFLLKRRHFGVRCTECYDEATREVLETRCGTCYGTSWEGGFFDPVEILGRRLASQVQTDQGPNTKDDLNFTRIQVLDFPRVDEGDLLVEKYHNRRFLVKQRYFTSLKTIPVHQTLSVSELGRKAVEYDIPLSLL